MPVEITNYLHVKTTNAFLTIVFKASLLPYFIIMTASMKRNTLMEHKKAIVVCEESGPISLNYNTLLTTSEIDIITKHVIPIVTTKLNI
jgi:hypothetical protein